ncbi:hypothetical protein KSS87_018640 [Heliosperma pusillum]|nr:hypothetical protein KSS87_018640 [Heliosperma pusillum]
MVGAGGGGERREEYMREIEGGGLWEKGGSVKWSSLIGPGEGGGVRGRGREVVVGRVCCQPVVASHGARLDDLSNDSHISSENVEVIMPQSTVVLPVLDSSLIQDGVPGFLNFEPILPNQGIPLQEPDEPFIHPDTSDKLFLVVFEDLSGKKMEKTGRHMEPF